MAKAVKQAVKQSTKKAATKRPTKKAAAKEVVVKEKKKEKLTAKQQQEKRDKAKEAKKAQKAAEAKDRQVSFGDKLEKDKLDVYVKLLNECLEREPDELATSANHLSALAVAMLRKRDPMNVPTLASTFNSGLLPKLADKLKASSISDPSRKKDGVFIDRGFGLRNKIWEAQHKESSKLRVIHAVGTRNIGVHGDETTGRVRLDSIALLPEAKKFFDSAEGKKLIAGLQKKFFKKDAF